MKTTVFNTAEIAVPQAYISLNKSRLQSSNNKYYLNSNQEFEIELFNPLQEKISCSIKLNGKKQNYQLILYPGKRVFLERFFDDSKKFKFDTYQVENTKESKNAISLNGKIEINFFKEQSYSIDPNTINNYPPYITYTWLQPGVFYNSVTNYTNSAQPIGNSTNNLNFTKSVNRNIETGRVEKGNTSNQIFYNSNENFNTFSFYHINIQLLPISTKPEKLNVIYCTNCQRKQKNNWKFCPSCGEKFITL